MTIRVEVVRAWPRRHEVQTLQLADGATVADALAASRVPTEGIGGQAVHGERVAIDAQLRNGDRLELLPPLRLDPKEARRRRAARR